jgi:tetratricopeptide (TPR) repeat protein
MALVTVPFAAGLMAKPMLVTVPFVLLLLDYWPLSRARTLRLRRLFTEKVPLLVIAVFGIMIAIAAGRGALLSSVQMPLASRVANALLAYPGYLSKTVWPTRLAVLYPVSATYTVTSVIGAAVLLAGVTALAVIGGRRFPYVPIGWLWFIGTLVPVIGLLQAGVQAIADRFTYLPSIGLFIVLAFGAADFTRSWRLSMFSSVGAAIFAIGTLAAVTRLQLAYWRDSATLLTHAVKVTSSNWLAHNNLGYALAEQGRDDEAIAQYRAALEIQPAYPAALNNLGVSLAKQGKIEDAITAYRTAVGINPDYFTSLNNLGELLLRQGKVDEAAVDFMAALRAKPDYALATHNLGMALALQGRADEAADYFRTALRLQPRYADAHYNLGAALAAQGKTDEAARQFAETLAIDSRYAKAHAALGNIFFREGRWADAVARLTEALRLNPDLADAHFHLATILSAQGRADEAREHYAQAVRLQPDLARQVPPDLARQVPPRPQ